LYQAEMGAVDMAIETHVLFDAPLPSIAALNAELKALGFPVRFQGGHGPLRTQGGFRPINVRGEQSGCEIDIRRGADAADELELPESAGTVSACAGRATRAKARPRFASRQPWPP
jgi:hypothetical protein